MRKITFGAILLVTLFLLDGKGISGSNLPIGVYQLKYNAEINKKLEIVPECVFADIGEYRFGYAVFAKRFRSVQQENKYLFNYLQENEAYMEDIQVRIDPWIKDNKIEVYLDYSKCQKGIEKLKAKGIKIEDLIDGIGNALQYTYQNQAMINKKIESIILHVEGVLGKDDLKKEYHGKPNWKIRGVNCGCP